VKDIDFARLEIRVRDGKGRKDRVTPLPRALVDPLREQFGSTRELHENDVALGFGETLLPTALARKYPSAGREWGWQYVLPATSRFKDRPARTVQEPLGHRDVRTTRICSC
jgi:integrase